MEQKQLKIKDIIISHKEIVSRSKELANKINEFYAHFDQPIILLGILKGCIMFLTELAKNLTIPCVIEFMAVSSFDGGLEAQSQPQIILDIPISVEKRDILIIEDIIDSGNSLKLINDYLILKGAKSVNIVTMLDKDVPRENNLAIKWTGFKIKNEFLIGFGLDYYGQYRNLPYIATVKWENEGK